MPGAPHARILRCAVALLLVGGVTAAAYWFHPYFRHGEQMLLLQAVVVVSALLGGLIVGLAATAAAAFSCRFLLDPHGEFSNLGSLLILAAAGVLCSILSERQLRAETLAMETNRKLRQQISELEDFNCVVCHDLKSPLRTIQSFCQLLERQTWEKLDAGATQTMNFIQSSADRMGRLIEGLLAYSRTSSSEGMVTDTNEVVMDVMRALRTEIDAAGATITFDPLPAIRMDDHVMFQLVENLIANAIKYRSERAPLIHISGQRRTADFCIVVTDNGIGIDMKHAERIFEPFQRLHTRAEHEGAGLGLATCKKTALRHGGKIWVESEPGVGSSFYIALPWSRIVGPGPLPEAVNAEEPPEPLDQTHR